MADLALADLRHAPSEPARRVAGFPDSLVRAPYTLARFTCHRWLRDLADGPKISDLSIVSDDKGQLACSAGKDVDFGTSLVEGPCAMTSMARLFRQIMGRHRNASVGIVDSGFRVPALGGVAIHR